MLRNKLLIGFALSLFLVNCTTDNSTEKITINQEILQDCNTAIQNAVVVDHVSPPVAGRRYFYASLAAYETLVPYYDNFISTGEQFKGFKTIDLPDTSKTICLDLAAMSAHTYVSGKLVYNQDSINSFKDRALKIYKDKLSKTAYKNSIEWGEKVGDHIIAWAKTDSFDQIRGKDEYLATREPGTWQSTAPDNSAPIEPNWMKVRTCLVPSNTHIKIDDPEPYSEDKNSRFYKITKEVYDTVQAQQPDNVRIAKYWDDNPNSTTHIGHVTIHKLKISPAGHWLAMFTQVARKQNYSLMETAEGYMRASAVMHDAFIVAWDTKYRTNYIRPQTAIRTLFDSTWLSAIQTPPFPEYPSAHSVVSGSVSTLLETYYGKFSFADSSEFEFGLGTETFDGFIDAANHACISRLYGGIHFTDAIVKGQLQGNDLGRYHLANLKTRIEEKAAVADEVDENKN